MVPEAGPPEQTHQVRGGYLVRLPGILLLPTEWAVRFPVMVYRVLFSWGVVALCPVGYVGQGEVA